MTHTPFVSNPCPATAIVFVSQNLFYGQLPQGAGFLLAVAGVFAGTGAAACHKFIVVFNDIAEQLLVGQIHLFGHSFDSIELIDQLLQLIGAVVIIG